MKAWNFIKNDYDQEMGKEYSTIVQIMEKDDRWKAIAWRLISCKMIAYHVSDEKTVQILSLHFVPSLYFVPGLQSVVTGLVLLFLFERASSPDRRIGTRKKILVRLSWPLWLMCGVYFKELPRKSTMMEHWVLYTDWRRKQMRDLPI